MSKMTVIDRVVDNEEWNKFNKWFRSQMIDVHKIDGGVVYTIPAALRYATHMTMYGYRDNSNHKSYRAIQRIGGKAVKSGRAVDVIATQSEDNINISAV